MHPPFGRTGGKSRLVKKLIPLIPTHYESYIEPFVGAGSIFYNTKKVKLEVINDLDIRVYLAHKGIRDEEDINERFRRNITKEEFMENKNKMDSVSSLEIIKHSYMANAKTFNDLKKIGSRKDKKGKLYTPSVFTDFNKYKPRLKDVIIRNEDYKSIIKEFDDENAFFYLDPPYENSNKTVHNSYEDINLDELSYIVKKLKGKFMLSINDSENNRNRFKDFNIIEIETLYTGVGITGNRGGTKKVNELVITNY